jgi:hypothetical protein
VLLNVYVKFLGDLINFVAKKLTNASSNINENYLEHLAVYVAGFMSGRSKEKKIM